MIQSSISARLSRPPASSDHVDYSHNLWWDFAADSGAPKMLRASLLVVIMLIAFGLLRLMRASREPTVSRDGETLAKVAAIISQRASSTANVAKAYLRADDALLPS